MPTLNLASDPGEPQTAEYSVIKDKVPGWLIQASAPTREAFKYTSTEHVEWLDRLTQAERRQLGQYNDASATSQQAVDQAMAGLQTAEAFATPLLAAALKQRFSLEPDLEATYLELRNPVELGLLGIEVGSFSVLTLSLLQAALHNFEESECAAGAFATASRFKRGPAPDDATLSLGISIHGFLSLCRTLDIGAQYQAHLSAFFQTASGLRERVNQAQKDALQAAAYLALLKQDITPANYAVIQAVIAGQREIDDDGKPVWFSDVSIMGLRLSGCTAFVSVEKHQHAREVLVYIPHDPEHPLKRYASSQALEAELTRQLMADVNASSGPGRYQRFLANYLEYADQPTYWRRLTQKASEQPHDPFAVARVSRYVLPFVSAIVSVFVTPKELPPVKTVREPIKDPEFYIRVISKGELWADNVDVWRDNFDKLQAKLIADARGHAVPTDDVDAQARAKKIATLEQAGLLALNLVSMFVPGLGEVMMGVMVAQLLYETFEGVVEWHEGDREAALEHLTDVAENLAFVAVMAAGGAGVRKALGTPAVIEAVKPVTLASGEQKLWKADLTPYTVAVHLPADAKPDALGFYAHEGQTVLPLEGKHFEVRRDPIGGEYRIQHPARPNAYAPGLEHNHEGAWQHELDQPLTWDDATTLRRLGLPVEGLSAQRLQQACEASGTAVDALRAGHLDHEPIPLALADTLQRFKVADEMGAFIRQIKSADSAQYAKADPALQMDLLRRKGLLPARPLGVYEANGKQLWNDAGAPGQARRVVILPDGALERGELLQEVLEFLQEDDPALREFPGDTLADRAQRLRQYLGEQAQALEGSLVEARYRARNVSFNPDVTRLQVDYPRLPGPMAEHLLNTLGADQLQRFRSTGQLPESVVEQARWQTQELRLTRACEGLFVDALVNPDTALLQASAHGSPVSREAMRTVLLENPLRKPAYDPLMRLLGGGRGIRQLMSAARNAFRAPAERAHRLFPSYTDAQVANFITSLGTDVRSELSRLEAEYFTLKRDLKTWVRANAPQANATAFDRQGGFVKTYANEIKRCWRRETDTLTITPGPRLNLPALSADFSHVENLELSNIPWTSEAHTFLSRFKHLKSLRIRDGGLTELPESLADMPNLTHLRLRQNRIHLTPQSVEQLGRLSRLEFLDLAQNPLGIAPDLSGMPHLKYVDLSNTRLQQWPTGLRELTQLRELNLRDNLLQTVPLEHLEPLPEDLEKIIKINSATALSGNPLTVEAEQALDAYWRRLSHSHPDLLEDGRGDNFSVFSQPITQVRDMYPNFDVSQCRRYIWGLGQGAGARLDELSLEFTTLKEQLDAWVFSGGGARQRYIRMGRVRENAVDRDHRIMAKSRILACWRRETPERLSAEGVSFGQELDLSDLTLPALPDLDANFSHVGSLRLTRMNLSTSPEGFLAGFRGLRWLDMSNNQLRELPPALSEMHGLTRLFLDNNQIQLTPETARVLSERRTLRALWLSNNPLGQVPDFSQISDIRSVRLSRTGIDHWPAGLGEQALLDEIDLGDNQLTTLPDFVIDPSDAQLTRSVRLSAITRIANNPLTEATLQQVRTYSAQLERDGLLQLGRPLRLTATALALRPAVVASPLGATFRRWAVGFTPEQVAARTPQWMTLRSDPNSRGFFGMLADMDLPEGGDEDLQLRVWAVIDSITEANPDSAALRQEMFSWAGNATCCDRAALSFSNIEIMRMVHLAKASATEASEGPVLLNLARGLFRLDEVEKTALLDIARRANAIHADPNLSAELRDERVSLLEDVEIRLAYRDGLKGDDQLALPGQLARMRFLNIARVTQANLNAARTRILALNNSPEELHALLSRDFWKDYITHTYRPQFEALSKPYHEQLAGLLDQVEASQLPRADYEVQARALQDQLGIAEAGLIENLTRSELAQHPLPGPPAP
ncbi:MAG: DUF6543 domain-containing protein [Pseudomonas sp.]|uniref:NEL-type E3 ubiquitin ligase domain-containing protein n=1 Tax=Pseudomonas sp. TaxID=306 RepID=UPI003C706290